MALRLAFGQGQLQKQEVAGLTSSPPLNWLTRPRSVQSLTAHTHYIYIYISEDEYSLICERIFVFNLLLRLYSKTLLLSPKPYKPQRYRALGLLGVRFNFVRSHALGGFFRQRRLG